MLTRTCIGAMPDGDDTPDAVVNGGEMSLAGVEDEVGSRGPGVPMRDTAVELMGVPRS